jgi:hypothetical protein
MAIQPVLPPHLPKYPPCLLEIEVLQLDVESRAIEGERIKAKVNLKFKLLYSRWDAEVDAEPTRIARDRPVGRPTVDYDLPKRIYLAGPMMEKPSNIKQVAKELFTHPLL